MNPVKIDVFDRYIMRGGDQSLQNIEDLCDFGFNMLQQPFEPELFDDVVIDDSICYSNHSNQSCLMKLSLMSFANLLRI